MLSSITLATALAIATGPTHTDPDVVHLKQCQVFLIHDVDIPAVESGQLISSSLQAGIAVKQGQQLAALNDQMIRQELTTAQLAVKSARARAEDEIEIRYAEKSLELAQAELQQDLGINQNSPGTVPTAEIRRKRLAEAQAQLQVERSRLQHRLAGMAVEAEQAGLASVQTQVKRRQIVAPFPGTIVDVFRQPGEWVNKGEAVARIVRLDVLRVDGFVQADQVNVHTLRGRKVRVSYRGIDGSRQNFSGHISFVNPMMLAGNRYRIQAEVINQVHQNAWGLEPGRIVAMDILPSSISQD